LWVFRAIAVEMGFEAGFHADDFLALARGEGTWAGEEVVGELQFEIRQAQVWAAVAGVIDLRPEFTEELIEAIIYGGIAPEAHEAGFGRISRPFGTRRILF
jgi:hypothetical protein